MTDEWKEIIEKATEAVTEMERSERDPSAEIKVAQRLQKQREMFEISNVPLHFAKKRGLTFQGVQLEKLEKLTRMLGSGFTAVLAGLRGNGKTQMAVELVKRTIRADRPAYYTTIMEVLIDLKATYRKDSDESERDVLARLRKPALLVLDEFEKRAETPWEGNMIFELLNKRYGDDRDTLIISNSDADEVEARLGPSLSSRINETGGIIECDWESFRA